MRTTSDDNLQGNIDPSEFKGEDELQSEATIDGRTWQKTITARTIEAHPERANTKKELVICCRIAGEVFGTQEVPADPKAMMAASQKGERYDDMLTVLVGEFKADSYSDDGEVYQFAGMWCALPILQDVILGRLQKMVDDGVEHPRINFDWVFASYPAPNLTGYSWRARNLQPVSPTSGFLSDMNMEQRRQHALAMRPEEFGGGKQLLEHKAAE